MRTRGIDEGHVVDERGRGIRTVVRPWVADGDRLHADAGFDRRLEEGRVETAERTAVGRGALGNTATDWPAASAAATRAFTRAASRRLARSRKNVSKPAAIAPHTGQRRVSALATKRDGQTAVQYLYVEPRDMVGDEKERTAVRHAAAKVQPHADHAQQLARQPRREAPPAIRAQERGDESGDRPDTRRTRRRFGRAGARRRASSSCRAVEAIGEPSGEPLHRQHHDDVRGSERLVPRRWSAHRRSHTQVAAHQRR